MTRIRRYWRAGPFWRAVPIRRPRPLRNRRGIRRGIRQSLPMNRRNRPHKYKAPSAFCGRGLFHYACRCSRAERTDRNGIPDTIRGGKVHFGCKRPCIMSAFFEDKRPETAGYIRAIWRGPVQRTKRQNHRTSRSLCRVSYSFSDGCRNRPLSCYDSGRTIRNRL